MDNHTLVRFAIRQIGPSGCNDLRRHPIPNLGISALDTWQLNAVLAAFKAGITPARIARQFGMSQSDVKKALANWRDEVRSR